jgi:hypothetical protein
VRQVQVSGVRPWDFSNDLPFLSEACCSTCPSSFQLGVGKTQWAEVLGIHIKYINLNHILTPDKIHESEM